ncbi:hypothetical protein GCM10011613_03070 [Cellvibrio zantedeschiae]|uniref:Class I SAM-dependent methyltransferase n=1 Tax=Cellvibrio zantedeschiae TaxID=1237077 RepID=A0ABQ3ASM7_9GAMM|nr:class I SAM-dependent methyltransferase [Cellvibrio zantedeschiae]GGY62902.1 hypothetical protein GCM10011613_03070 [Cellvibrio zantedeschiae]
MTLEMKERRPHAVLNLETRYLKAKKIELLISSNRLKEPIRLLEVGTGSGGIAYYFSSLSDIEYEVTAVDVKDNRLTEEGFEFQLVEGVELPYDNESFDVVISNHVIEHVGDLTSQLEHLSELNRVLTKSGIGYLAVPNRWMLVEPHYKLIFLSWLPKFLRSPYLRLFGKGHYYDCEPLQKHEIESMFKKTNFEFKNVCVRALKLTFDIEMPNSLPARVIKYIPTFMIELFTPLIPTLIYTIRKSEEKKRLN